MQQSQCISCRGQLLTSRCKAPTAVSASQPPPLATLQPAQYMPVAALFGLLSLLGLLQGACTAASCDTPACFAAWLGTAGAPEAQGTLEAAGYSSLAALLEQRPQLADAKLKTLGVPMKARKRLLKALAAEVENPSEAASALWKRDGVAVGHRQVLTLEDGRAVTSETLSLQPLVLRIEGYLTSGEVDALLQVAQRKQLSSASIFSGSSSTSGQELALQDIDSDGVVSLHELRLALDQLANAHLDLEDVRGILATLGIDSNGDGVLTQEELSRRELLDLGTIGRELKALLERQPQVCCSRERRNFCSAILIHVDFTKPCSGHTRN
jgi:hypothetical protein